MSKVRFSIDARVCEECALALRRFIGHMDGVESIDVEDSGIAVSFDESMMAEERLTELTRDSLEKLGHKLRE